MVRAFCCVKSEENVYSEHLIYIIQFYRKIYIYGIRRDGLLLTLAVIGLTICNRSGTVPRMAALPDGVTVLWWICPDGMRTGLDVRPDGYGRQLAKQKRWTQSEMAIFASGCVISVVCSVGGTKYRGSGNAP